MIMTSKIRLAFIEFHEDAVAGDELLEYMFSHNVEDIESGFAKKFGTHYINKVWLGGRVESVVTISTCISETYNFQDIQAAAKFEVQKGVKAASGEASASNQLTQRQQEVRNKMSFKHYMVGGEAQLPEEAGEFDLADWSNSVTIEGSDVIEVALKDYKSLLQKDGRIDSAKIQAADDSITSFLRAAVKDPVEPYACAPPQDDSETPTSQSSLYVLQPVAVAAVMAALCA